MAKSMLVVGGGIGGLAAAFAGARSGWRVDVLEQATQFGEVGAGIQLGPNVVRILHAQGLEPALRAVAAYPERLDVRNAMQGGVVGTLPLGQSMVQRYGAPYLTIARPDMHRLLLDAVQASGEVQLTVNSRVVDIQAVPDRVGVLTSDDRQLEADVLLGADGLWSTVRGRVVADGPPRVTGHLAFRAMVAQAELPEALRSQVVTVWLGHDFHAVQYPVRGGAWLNVVCIVHGTVAGDPSEWDQSANAAELRSRLNGACSRLRDLVQAIDHWRLWALCDRPPMASAAEHARGRIALLGDAAHPMRPYLAQGAGMAIEDAACLAESLSDPSLDVPQALQRYASRRWQRNARVQARAIRNGDIFHLKGPMQFGRDLAIRVLGPKLLDVPWLYGER